MNYTYVDIWLQRGLKLP